jgi:hypothetical protein
MRKNFIDINLYSSENYRTGKSGLVRKRVNVDGLSEEEIKKIVDKLKKEQKIKNATYNASYNKSLKSKSGIDANMIDWMGGTSPEIMEEYPIVSHTNLEIPKKQKFYPLFDKDTGNTFCLFGASKSGKTTFMMKLYNKYFPEHFLPKKKLLTTLFAMNSQIPLYDTDDKLIIKCDKIDTNVESYIDWQRKINKKNDNCFSFLNMFDDFIEIRHNTMLNNLILTYRNSNMSSIICLQYINLLSKQARSNINNVFLFKMNTDESIDVCLKVYLSSFIKKQNIEDQFNWYKSMTQDHNFIYIHPAKGRIFISKLGYWYNL